MKHVTGEELPLKKKIGGVEIKNGSFVNKPEMKWLMLLVNSSQVSQP